jgi:hypothetical protein
VAVLLAAACQRQRDAGGIPAPAEAVRVHTTFLAADALEGRGTGTRGYQQAAAYVARQFEALGLEAAGTDGTYFQPVRFRRVKPVAARASLVVRAGGSSSMFTWGTDFVGRGDAARAVVELHAPIVFVGYGISDPSQDHDDYTRDVRGSIVAFLPGVPPHLPAARQEYYTSLKGRLARERGAVATIELSTPEEDRAFPWATRLGWVDVGASTWLDAEGATPAEADAPRLLFSTAGTERLLALAGRTLSSLRVPRPPAFAVADATFSIASQAEEFSSPHVIARLPGADPSLRGEHVLVVAHLDGLGRGEPVNGDDIYNGAIDNALGAALLLAGAQRLSALDERPRRSVLFLATTGEELGIVGSPYFVAHPTVPLDAIVAAVNIDGPSQLTGPVRTILAMGAQNSTLGAAVERAASSLGLQVKSAAAPLNYSDHYPFVMKGIPALWLVQAEDGPDSAEEKDASTRPHTPRDDLGRPFRWESAETLLRLHVALVRDVASQPRRPEWLAGDLLGQRFGIR